MFFFILIPFSYHGTCLFAGVKACVAANGPVNEEHYEISLVNYGRSGGPKAGRLMASTNVSIWLLQR